MELVVFGILLALTFSAVQGGTPKCCVETTKVFPFGLLKKVNNYEVQSRYGVCSIDALVLHIGDKHYCATLKLQRIVQYLLKQKFQEGVKNI